MNLSLTSELEALVRRKVASGLYNSASEVVREALRLMAARDVLEAAKLEALRKDIAVGLAELDAGQGTALDIEAVKAEARRVTARRKVAHD